MHKHWMDVWQYSAGMLAQALLVNLLLQLLCCLPEALLP
jgi:hypothetical protein